MSRNWTSHNPISVRKTRTVIGASEHVPDFRTARAYGRDMAPARSGSATTRRVDASQLVGAAEIAERLGLKQQTHVHVWRGRYDDFPKPVATLKQGLVWSWPDVERWARSTGRLTSKPVRRTRTS
jgi:predicted DNA-binding transcriptional regulator AlpA